MFENLMETMMFTKPLEHVAASDTGLYLRLVKLDGTTAVKELVTVKKELNKEGIAIYHVSGDPFSLIGSGFHFKTHSADKVRTSLISFLSKKTDEYKLIHENMSWQLAEPLATTDIQPEENPVEKVD